jgi:Holliday junction resolvase RusA-like endonuclease
MTITITIPWTPQAQVGPNSRGSSRNARQHHRANRDVAVLAVRSQMAREPAGWTAPDVAALDITVAWERGRMRHDIDNITAMCKGAIDGVTRELGFDDRRIVALTVAQTRDPNGAGFTTFTIRDATESERNRAA